MMLFPFSHLDNVALITLNMSYPCKVCQLECVSDCIQCDLCDWWLHVDCIHPGFNLDDYCIVFGTSKCKKNEISKMT